MTNVDIELIPRQARYNVCSSKKYFWRFNLKKWHFFSCILFFGDFSGFGATKTQACFFIDKSRMDILELKVSNRSKALFGL